MTATENPAKKARRSFEREPNSLRCYKCGNRKLRIGNDIVLRRRARRGDDHSKKYPMVAIDCPKCGHQWYSMHKDAIETSHKYDENIERRHRND